MKVERTQHGNGRIRKRPLEDRVVVITGASSGIGRATALEFAKQGAALALAARSEEGLNETAAACRHEGAEAFVHSLDVANDQAVSELARAAAERYGRIDVWVNNAAVFVIGPFEKTPTESIRRVIETDLIGAINGAKAVLPYFRKQGGGTLINVSSLDAEVSQPYAAPYVAAKFGVRGLSKSLRQELRGSPIHVCTVLPAVIDTPLFQHSANFSGKEINAMPPVYPPERVARAIAALAKKPKREVYIGGSARALGFLHHVFPGLTERAVGWYAEKTFFKEEPAKRREGNLFEPREPEGQSRGGWKEDRNKLVPTTAGLASVGIVWYLFRKRRR